MENFLVCKHSRTLKNAFSRASEYIRIVLCGMEVSCCCRMNKIPPQSKYPDRGVCAGQSVRNPATDSGAAIVIQEEEADTMVAITLTIAAIGSRIPEPGSPAF